MAYATLDAHPDGSERPVYADVVSAVAWHPTRPRLASASLDGSIRMWGPADNATAADS